MNVKRVLTGSMFFVSVLSLSYSQSPFSKEIDGMILKGMDFTFLCQFDSALTVFETMESILPNEIVGSFYRAATLQSMMMDYETDRWEQEFTFQIEKAIRIGEEKQKQTVPQAWDLFYLGNAYSYKGLYQAKSGSLLAGIVNAHRGVAMLRKALSMDSTLYDALIEVGGYEYWSSRFYRYLKWLPWINSDGEQGIRMVEKGIEKGTFSYCVGLCNLGWIEYDRKKYDSALVLFEKGLQRYPGSRFFLWGIADCLYKLNRFDESIEFYERLLDSIRNGDINNGYNEAECSMKLALSHYALGHYDSALRYSDTILALKPEPKIAKRMVKQKQTAQAVRKKCIKAIKEQNG